MSNVEQSQNRPDPGDPRWRISPTKIAVTVILLIGIIVPLLVSTYASDSPRLWGFPFFYWYQMLWVFIAAGLCALSYVLIKREHDRFRRDHPSAGGPTTGGRADRGTEDQQ